MNAIKATWTKGKILPAEPVDWPEGSPLAVEPLLPCGEQIGLDERDWRDDAESLADWDAWLRTIEPPLLTEEERESLDRYREEFRRHNLEAVRKQMESGNGQ
jgi:hypothetical protein